MPFKRRKDKLFVQDGCIFWGSRVVIPPPGRKLLLQELHETHSGGISYEKSRQRLHMVAWSGLRPQK